MAKTDYDENLGTLPVGPMRDGHRGTPFGGNRTYPVNDGSQLPAPPVPRVAPAKRNPPAGRLALRFG